MNPVKKMERTTEPPKKIISRITKKIAKRMPTFLKRQLKKTVEKKQGYSKEEEEIRQRLQKLGYLT